MNDELELWMVERNYRRSTINETLHGLRAMQRAQAGGAPLPASYKHAARRVRTFLQERHPRHGLAAWLDSRGATPITRAVSAKPSRRVRPARSFADADWQRLFDRVSGGDKDADRVLECMMTTGLRVGDVLRLERRTIREGLAHGVMQLERKGGTFIDVPIPLAAPWERLQDAMDKKARGTVAGWVCPESPETTCAYQRVSRRLKRHCSDLGLGDEYVHTHRIRRTVAVKAHRHTKDVVLVQQLLGHRSPQSTMKYLDEQRSDEVADLQREVLGNMYGDEP